MEKIFKLKENGTTARTEIVAGLTTFMTMAYIIALNPNLLTNFATGTPLWNAVFMATCIASAIGMLVMAFAANKPFAMAPGMGLNSFFAVVVANIATFTGLSYEEAFPAAMCIILVEGVFFVILTLFSIREKIVEAIPFGIRIGITPAIGLMLLNVGFGSNAGLYSEKGGPFFVLSTFFGSLTPSVARDTVGSAYPQLVLYVVTMLVAYSPSSSSATTRSRHPSFSACSSPASFTGAAASFSWTPIRLSPLPPHPSFPLSAICSTPPSSSLTSRPS